MHVPFPLKGQVVAVSHWGPFSLHDKNAVVTGGAMGIGLGIVKRLAEARAGASPQSDAPASSPMACERDAPGGRASMKFAG